MAFKGQNSIEYLSTYGWMLLIVAISSGVFYQSYLPEQQCQNDVSVEMANQLQIADIATDSEGQLTLLIRNMGAEKATVQSITASNTENSTALNTDKTINPVEEEAFRLSDTKNTESCDQIDIQVEFNSTNLGMIQDSGELEGEFTVT